MIAKLSRPHWPRPALVAAFATTLLATPGCGSALKTVPVKGSVTFGGSPPPHPCFVNFLPTGFALPSGPTKDGASGVAGGVGECDASGTFQAISLRDRKGLMPGRYEVLVSCCLPNKNPNAPPVSVVPPDFRPPELVIPADARSVRYDINVPGAAQK